MAELADDIIETIDENGEVVRFKLIDLIEYEGIEYAILLPEDYEESEDSEMILMRSHEDEDGITLEEIEDDEEFEAVAEFYNSLEDYDDEEE